MFYCPDCDWKFFPEDLDYFRTQAASLDGPEEGDAFAPCCGKPFEELEEVA